MQTGTLYRLHLGKRYNKEFTAKNTILLKVKERFIIIANTSTPNIKYEL